MVEQDECNVDNCFVEKKEEIYAIRVEFESFESVHSFENLL